jgi:hypothetical protein
MIHTIDLVAPPLTRSHGLRPWEAVACSMNKSEQGREGVGGAIKCQSSGKAGMGQSVWEPVDVWQTQVLQLLVLQALSDSKRSTGTAVLPPALAHQLFRLPYGKVACHAMSLTCAIPVESLENECAWARMHSEQIALTVTLPPPQAPLSPSLAATTTRLRKLLREMKVDHCASKARVLSRWRGLSLI